jgi:hypothetical protein
MEVYYALLQRPVLMSNSTFFSPRMCISRSCRVLSPIIDPAIDSHKTEGLSD